MHSIEPHFRWRDFYIASEDKRSPFYGRKYNEFSFSHQLYNYYLHPQWDEFGSSTLYAKILFVEYEVGYALIELIGEWNDILHNDIMMLKRYLAEPLMNEGVTKFVFFCENVLNFHGGDDDYYAEWSEEVREEGGWITLINTRTHIQEEIHDARLNTYLNYGDEFNDVRWQIHKPELVFMMIDALVNGQIKRLL